MPRAFSCVLLTLLASACARSHPPDGTGGPGPALPGDGGRIPGCTPAPETCNGRDDDCDGRADEDGACCTRTRTPVTDVDLLFMIDNSNSMVEEQGSLAAQFPRIVRTLATGDLNGDGAADFTPPRSLHLGVITSDMGTGGFAVPTCHEPSFGDDGVLRTQGNTALAGCMASYPSFLEFTPSTTGSIETVAGDLRCVAQMGTGGCGFEQQLEAVLKAVTPSSSGITFTNGTRGHADRVNAGFVRPDALLAVILLTDEEDCSASDPELFNPSSGVYGGDLNLRCFSYPAAVHPIQRYVDGLLAIKSDPSQIFYAAIAGVPVDLAESDATYEDILADPRMQEVVDPSDPNRLRPSCNVPGRGLAFPPRRIVSLARELEASGASASIGSVCQEDYSTLTTRLLASLATATSTAEVCR